MVVGEGGREEVEMGCCLWGWVLFSKERLLGGGIVGGGGTQEHSSTSTEVQSLRTVEQERRLHGKISSCYTLGLFLWTLSTAKRKVEGHCVCRE
jgi:hypothetical protein